MSDGGFTGLHDQARSLSRMAYSDIGALKGVRGNDRAALEEAAAQFESLFVDIWLKSMREAGKAFGEGNYLSSSAVEMHQEMLDHQWAVHVSESGGVGLKEVLMRQLARHAPEPATAASEEGAEVPERQSFPHRHDSASPASVDRTEGGKNPLFEGAEGFVRTLEPLVRRIAGASGIHPVAVMAQAALETGWGSRVPHGADGRPSYNLFGIKAHQWEGESVNVPTLEHQLDRFVRKVESFRAYEGIAEAVKDYVNFLSDNERYAGALRVAQDPDAFADALQEAGYATDPGYADKLKALQRQITDMLGGGAG